MACPSKAVLALAALLVSGGAVAAESYAVSATLAHAGEVFATPAGMVHADQEASVSVPGEDGYTFTFTVTDLAPDQIQVDAKVVSEHGSMEPTLIVRPDVPAAVSLGDLNLEIEVSRGGG